MAFTYFLFSKVLESVSAERLKTQCINFKSTQVFMVRFISLAEFHVCVILFVFCLKYASRAVAPYIFVSVLPEISSLGPYICAYYSLGPAAGGESGKAAILCLPSHAM